MTDNIQANGVDENVVPRDVRILHLILASQSIQSYEDHVPLQLMDFAHRYTAGVLKDAVIYNDHAKGTGGSGTLTGKNISTEDIRLAIAARTNYQFNPVTPKELMLELAAERNKKSLPPVLPGYGIRLPPEKYCLTARDWSLSDEEYEVSYT
ncbi:CYFA0S17e01178g1_1 [Cyberlindnera fabianii]|uniref:CYFA0S17e01178g1_1 n=1 Tax=Cyberlindnera fabianii TaxID=36022 RepID=A0A061B642_CYBFA|nr:CYFA0S17e01178g1_1 [Cyberlindnera fabianii]